jgi:hypothetical protein
MFAAGRFQPFNLEMRNPPLFSERFQQHHLLQLGLGKCDVCEMWHYNTLHIKCIHFSVIQTNHCVITKVP